MQSFEMKSDQSGTEVHAGVNEEENQ